MTDGAGFVLVLLAALGSGVMAGVFFAFSTSIMNGLGRLAPARGIDAMQSINLAILNPLFLAVFMGTALFSTAVAVVAVLHWGEPGSTTALVGSAAYVVGAFVVTLAINVPMNNALMAADAASSDGATVWARYLRRWTAWNHLRAAASLGASLAFVLALVADRY